MVNSIPKKQEQFFFNYFSDSIFNWNLYFIQLRETATRITQVFGLYSWRMITDEFWLLLSAVKTWKEVNFISWVILSDTQWNFKHMDKCKIQDLNLNETGNNELSN